MDRIPEDMKMYSLSEVSEILNLTRRTLYNYVKTGQLTATKIGREWRVSTEEIKRFQKEGTSADYYTRLIGE